MADQIKEGEKMAATETATSYNEKSKRWRLPQPDQFFILQAISLTRA